MDKEDNGVANSDSLGGRQKNLYGLTYDEVLVVDEASSYSNEQAKDPTYDEVLVVDPATPISREEYLAYKETNAKC